MIRYIQPDSWIRYDPLEVSRSLTEAKAAALSLRAIPYQRSWAEALQQVQLKREIAGTSRIEGAHFTERELDEAMRESPQQLATRSLKQAAAALSAYRRIAALPDDYPFGGKLVLEIHRNIVTGADDDHCPPGELRATDQNVSFGVPRHRGAAGGTECRAAFETLCRAVGGDMASHDPLIRALAAHYHLAAMHPFLDGNGRTARALEAFLLRKAGLRDTLFIAMSNYYYENKDGYLKALADTRAGGHDLRPFLVFGLEGIRSQCARLLEEIREHLSRALFRNVMHDLFGRLESSRKRVIAKRQLQILELLLEEEYTAEALWERMKSSYRGLRGPWKAFERDLGRLFGLEAIEADEREGVWYVSVRLEWPAEISESEFFECMKKMPGAKTPLFRQARTVPLH